MKILREKIFGAIKKANKAKKKAWEVENGRQIGSRSDSDYWAKVNTRSTNLADSVGAAEVRLVGDGGEHLTSFGVERIQDSIFKDDKVPLHDKINAKAYYKGQGRDIPKEFVDNTECLTTDYRLSKYRPCNNGIDSRLEAARKGTTKQGRVKKSDYLKREELQASIEKHKEKADKLRNNNKLKVAARDAKSSAKKWIKENPGKSAAIGATVAAAGAGLGYAAYKHHKNKKKEETKED